MRRIPTFDQYDAKFEVFDESACQSYTHIDTQIYTLTIIIKKSRYCL